MSCALELSYCDVECLVIHDSERLGGQLWQISDQLLNLASGYFKDGASLAQSMQKLLEKTQIRLLLSHNVSSVDAENKTVMVNSELYRAKTILLATGYRFKRIDLPGASLFQKDIFYGHDSPVSGVVKKRLAVLGGGDNAVMKALALSDLAEQVFLLNHSNHWRSRAKDLEVARLNKRIEIIENTELESLSGVDSLSGARLIDRNTGRFRNIAVDALFVNIGYAPNTELVRHQIAVDDTGHIVTDRWGRCSVSKIYAAGDIVAEGGARIATAFGSGSKAAMAIQLDLGLRLSASTCSSQQQFQ